MQKYLASIQESCGHAGSLAYWLFRLLNRIVNFIGLAVVTAILSFILILFGKRIRRWDDNPTKQEVDLNGVLTSEEFTKIKDWPPYLYFDGIRILPIHFYATVMMIYSLTSPEWTATMLLIMVQSFSYFSALYVALMIHDILCRKFYNNWADDE